MDNITNTSIDSNSNIEHVIYPTQYLYVIADAHDAYESHVSATRLSQPLNATEFQSVDNSQFKRLENPLISSYFDTYSEEIGRFVPTEELLYEYPMDFDNICPDICPDFMKNKKNDIKPDEKSNTTNISNVNVNVNVTEMSSATTTTSTTTADGSSGLVLLLQLLLLILLLLLLILVIVVRMCCILLNK